MDDDELAPAKSRNPFSDHLRRLLEQETDVIKQLRLWSAIELSEREPDPDSVDDGTGPGTDCSPADADAPKQAENPNRRMIVSRGKFLPPEHDYDGVDDLDDITDYGR